MMGNCCYIFCSFLLLMKFCKLVCFQVDISICICVNMFMLWIACICKGGYPLQYFSISHYLQLSL